MWEIYHKEGWMLNNWYFWTVVLETNLAESLGLARKSTLNIHWKDWCWSWNSNTLATWCKELTHWKRHWCRERLKAEERDDRGWDGWMASPTQWTWVWASSGSWWWTGKPGMLQSVGPQRGGHDWATQLNTLWGATRNSREDRQKERRKASENLFSMSKSGRQRSFWIPNKISEVKGTDQTTYHFYFHVEGSFSILDPQNPDSPSIIQPVTSPVNLTSLSLESTHPPPSP